MKMSMKIAKYMNLLAIGAAAAVLSVGCTKDFKEDNGPAAEVKTVVTAGILETRTYMGPVGENNVRKVYWENGDKISINGTESGRLAGMAEGTASAEFTFSESLTYPYKSVYPSTAWKSDGTITLASVQETADGTFAQNALPMVAYAAEGGLKFKQICSVVKLSVKGEADIRYVEFSGNNGEQVCGDFAVNYETPAITASAAVADADKTVKVNVGKTLSGTATEIYVVVPAGTYSNGFTVKVVDNEGGYMEKATGESTDLAVGHVVPMAEFTYGNTGEAPLEDGTAENPWRVDSADEWLEMVADMNTDTPAKYAASAAYVVTDNLDFSGKAFAFVSSFTGTLDGAGYKFLNIVHSFTGNNNMGLVADNRGTIKNLTVEAEFTGKNQFGGVAGKNNGTLDNVFFKGKITSTGYYVGGVCGLNNKTILNSGFISGEVKSTSTGDSNGVAGIGGLCGYNKGKIANSRTLGGTVTHEDGTNSGNKNAGGLVGHNNAGVIINCYSWVEKVTSASNAGGLLGYGGGNGNIVNCYSICTDLTSKRANGTRSATVAYLNGHTARNVYGPAIDSKLVITKWDEKSNSADEINAVSAVLTAAQLANTGTVTVPTLGAGTGTCDNFVAALNKGVEISEAPAGITLKTWVADPVTGYPVLAE